MKHVSLVSIILCTVAVLFGACKNNDSSDLNTDQGEMTINFSVVNYKQYPLDDLARNANDQSDMARSESMTRATLAESLAHLNMTVFDADGNKYKEVLQESGSEGYGNFSLQLPYGTYTLIFFGYNGSKMVEISSPTDVHFPDGYVPNCFYKTITLTVDENTETTQGIVLERPVACFTLRCLPKTIPTDISQMVYKVEGCGSSLDATSGLANSINLRQGSSDLSKYDNKDTLSLNIYTFLPAQECNAKFTISALNKNGDEIKTRTFNNVPLKINLRTFYNGDFFSNDQDPDPETESSSTFSISLGNTKWEETNITY